MYRVQEMTKPCFICNKNTLLLNLLVGDHVYCSQDCWETHKFALVQKGIQHIVEGMRILDEGGTPEQIQKAQNILQQLQENLCQTKTWREVQRELEKLGTNN